MGALDGLKVLDLTSMVSGPVAAMMLADQGARVIKVEPLVGEQMRHIGGKHNEVSPAFYSCNRGKESISLDLKSDEGKKILLELAAASSRRIFLPSSDLRSKEIDSLPRLHE